jgi:hypothetical protein
MTRLQIFDQLKDGFAGTARDGFFPVISRALTKGTPAASMAPNWLYNSPRRLSSAGVTKKDIRHRDSGGSAIETGFQVAFALGADHLLGHSAILEDQQRGNGTNLELGGKPLIDHQH